MKYVTILLSKILSMLFSDKHLHTPTRLESDLTIAISENQLLRVKQLLAGVVDNGKQILTQAIFQFIPYAFILKKGI